MQHTLQLGIGDAFAGLGCASSQRIWTALKAVHLEGQVSNVRCMIVSILSVASRDLLPRETR